MFKEFLEKRHSEVLWGTIYLYGLDTKSQKFKGFWLPVNKLEEPMTWRPMRYFEENGFCLSPMVEEPQEKAIALEDEIPLAEGDGYVNFITRLIKVQRMEDQQQPIAKQAGIGGEIVLTVMGLDQKDEFFIHSSIAYTFPDYLEQGKQMMINSRT